MITGLTASILAAELLKVRKRWMPYVLFLFAVAGAAILIWLGGYGDWQDGEDFQYRQTALRTFSLPWSIPALLDTGQFWGAILVGILTASVVATEHSWGTVRQALIRGQSRSQYLAAKVLSIAIVATIGLLLAFGVGVVFSIIATAVADRPITLGLPSGGGSSVPGVALMVLRAAYGILPYGLLAFCLTVVGRSTALGLAGTMFYMFGEAIIVAILEGIGGVAADLRPYVLGHNVSALLAENRIGIGNYNSIAPRELPLASELPDPAIAALVVGLYCLGLLAIAFVIFNRRDVHA